MTYKLDKRLLTILIVAFIIATVIGTITHECGHYLVAKSLGYNARINYMSTWLTNSEEEKLISSHEVFLFILGGPLETVLTGTIGFILIFLFRKSFETATQLSFGQWILIFVSLFWLRQTANFVVWVGGYLVNGNFSGRGDEIKLSRILAIPDSTIALTTALIGAIVLAIVVFKFIPITQRFTFIFSGIIGGTAGYLLWLKSLGRIVMP